MLTLTSITLLLLWGLQRCGLSRGFLYAMPWYNSSDLGIREEVTRQRFGWAVPAKPTLRLEPLPPREKEFLQWPRPVSMVLLYPLSHRRKLLHTAPTCYLKLGNFTYSHTTRHATCCQGHWTLCCTNILYYIQVHQQFNFPQIQPTINLLSGRARNRRPELVSVMFLCFKPQRERNRGSKGQAPTPADGFPLFSQLFPFSL